MKKRKNISVITVGNAPSVKGGITSVITQIMDHDWKKENVSMEFIPSFRNGSKLQKITDFIRTYCKLTFRFITNKPDVLHMHMSHAGSFSRKYLIHKLCKIFGIADIVHLHSSGFVGFYDNSNEKKKKKIRGFLTECGSVIALGSEWEQRVRRIAPDARICVMNNTIRIPDTTTNQNVEILTFLYLGVLVKRKGVSDLLEAIKGLKEDGILDNREVLFKIGGTGDCEEGLRKYVADNDLSEYVEFLGWVAGEEKEKQLKSSQVLVLPSYNEGLPIAILEAISYGLPIVATDVGDVARAVHNEVNGFLFNPGDIKTLQKQLAAIVSSDEMRIKMSSASRKIAEEDFDDRQYFRKLAELYIAVQ